MDKEMEGLKEFLIAYDDYLMASCTQGKLEKRGEESGDGGRWLGV